MNPQFKIHGKKRKIIKKELSLLKLFIKNFWHFHQLDKDMAFIYGKKETNTYPMCDEKATKLYNETLGKIKQIEEKLKILYHENVF